jgi:hypothetical protein
MAYLTTDDAIRAFRSRSGYARLAEAELRKSAATSPSTRFDIFLSHSYEDAQVIGGVKALLEQEGLSVYVDWLEDPQADRSRVDAKTAELLRTRMNHSAFLLYASSRSSSNSKWMPWELGYFDGTRPGHVGILPILATPKTSFTGVEYLGLYPAIERVPFQGLGTLFGRLTGPSEGETLSTMARR